MNFPFSALDTVPLEDHFGDVLAKAQVGYGISNRELAEHLGVDTDLFRLWHRGGYDCDHDPLIHRAAEYLRLEPSKLLSLARRQQLPPRLKLPTDPMGRPAVVAFNIPFGSEMTVNHYLLLNHQNREALAIDCGITSEAALKWLGNNGFTLKTIVLTHAHRDHVGGLRQYLDAFPQTPVYAHPLEHPPTGESFHPLVEGHPIPFGNLTAIPLHTPGHSLGGLSFLIEKTLFTGDALFAHSIGGVKVNLGNALETIARKLLKTPPDTLLLPGHGPASTTAHERAFNPFFTPALLSMA